MQQKTTPLIMSTLSSPFQSDELNNSIELYCNASQIELSVLKFLSAKQIQTKTDPRDKEHKYWQEQRNDKLVFFNNELGDDFQMDRSLNLRSNKILQRKSRIETQASRSAQFDHPNSLF